MPPSQVREGLVSISALIICSLVSIRYHDCGSSVRYSNGLTDAQLNLMLLSERIIFSSITR